MKALIIGFGGMGCRHAQSLISSNQYKQIAVVEPSDNKFNEGLNKIKVSLNDVKRFYSVADYTDNADIVIISTSANPRFEIMKHLLQRGLRHFLVEKIVFQSIFQFNEIVGLLEANRAMAYCNFVNRYFSNYHNIREKIRTSNAHVSMTVTGGDLGLGCNAIHYMDLFEFLTGREISVTNSKLLTWTKENKRGGLYKEFSGLITAENSNNHDELTIFFDGLHDGGISIQIDLGTERYILSEAEGKEFCIKGQDINESTFNIMPSSKLTSVLVQDILNNKSLLTTIPQTKNVHGFLFKEMNRALNFPESQKTICPIT